MLLYYKGLVYKLYGFKASNGKRSEKTLFDYMLMFKLGIRASCQQDRIFIGMILILIFAEALGLYGFIVALIIANSSK